MDMERRIYEIALSMLSGVGSVKAKNLLDFFGDVEAVFTEKELAFTKIHGISKSIVNSWNRQACIEQAKHELEFIEKNNIQTHFYKESSYPSRLKNCDDGPIMLYTKGNLNLNRKNIAIVGTRKATEYGKNLVKNLVQDLKENDVQIISGLAYGIDVEAHKQCLENEIPTVAVLGHGLDLIYPAAHKSIAQRMLLNGGLVTEFATSAKGDTSNFPRRNRIVAGLCDAVVVVESAASGGSLITASVANDYNREVFAFPGNVDREFSQGCNRLIKQHKAHLIQSAGDIFNVMNWKITDKPKAIQTELFPELTENEDVIFSIIRDKKEVEIDDLAVQLKKTASSFSFDLFNLELKGLIKSVPGNKYVMM